MVLHFTKNLTTKHFQSQTFDNIISIKNESNNTPSPLQDAIVFPSRLQEQDTKQNKLLNLFDKEDTNAEDKYQDFTLEEEATTKSFTQLQ